MKAMICIFAIGVAAMLSSGAYADVAGGQVTFFKDVLPILQDNCQTCHRPAGANLSGMVAPMSLMTYEDTRPWAKAVQKAVENRVMPPWHADSKFHGMFANERTLSEQQIATLSNWVNQGAKRGNPAEAPAPRKFIETGWNFGTPDLVVQFEEPFFVKDDVQDLYENINVTLTEEMLPESRWLKAVQFMPGSQVVHHIIGHANPPKVGEQARTSRGMLGGNAPGADDNVFPEGFGIFLEKGSVITFAMHYHKEPGPGTGVWDSSSMGFQFHDQPAQHPVEISTISHGDFEIPPFAQSWRVGASRTFAEDTYLIGMLPHMHLRGQEARYTAFYPDGKIEELLHVPTYDFNWQTGYGYKEMRVLPAGTRIEMELWFTNTEERGQMAGIDPSRAIRFGGPTTDEMDLAWVTIAPVKPVEAGTQAGD